MDVLGYLLNHGVSGLNLLLLALVFYLVKSKLMEMDAKVQALWDWHNEQRGRQREDE